MFIKHALSTLILTVVNLTRLTWTCILVLLIKSRKRISENRSRKRLDHRKRSTMFDKVIHVIVDIICVVEYDRVFLETSNALRILKIHARICSSHLLRSMRTFATLVQTCVVRYTLEEISKICDVYDRYKFVVSSSLFIFSFFSFMLNSSVIFLFSLIDCVMRLSTIINIVAWFECL